jgi:hypothetical protein
MREQRHRLTRQLLQATAPLPLADLGAPLDARLGELLDQAEGPAALRPP